MIPIFLFEVKYYFNNLKEVIHLVGLFLSVVLLYPFSQVAGLHDSQGVAAGIVWIALTLAVSLGATSLFQRDHDSGRLEHYQLSSCGLAGIIFAKWAAYYLFITVPLAFILPVVALLVDIPVGAWSHYGIGLTSGAMALSLLATTIAVVMTGLEKVGAAIGLIMLPLTIPIIIFGTSYLADVSHDFSVNLLFLWGFSLVMAPILCLAGASCIRASN
jgi:heme exporter protein B